MLPELKARWVAALRSGKYTQAEETLHQLPDPDPEFPIAEGHCCLGVLCDIVPNGWDYLPNGTNTDLSDTGLAEVGLTDLERNKLVSMNDGAYWTDEEGTHHHEEKRSFHEIADWIEANL